MTRKPKLRLRAALGFVCVLAGVCAMLAFAAVISFQPWRNHGEGVRMFARHALLFAGPSIISIAIVSIGTRALNSRLRGVVRACWYANAPILCGWVPLAWICLIFFMPLAALLQLTGRAAPAVTIVAFAIVLLVLQASWEGFRRDLGALRSRVGRFATLACFVGSVSMGMTVPVFALTKVMIWLLR